MRRMDGVTATRALSESGSGPPVLVLTTFDDDDALWGALDAGAAGFVLKDANAEDLIAAALRCRRRCGMARPQGHATSAQRIPRQRSAPPHEAAKVDELTDRRARRAAFYGPRGHERRDRRSAVRQRSDRQERHVGAIFTKLGVRYGRPPSCLRSTTDWSTRIADGRGSGVARPPVGGGDVGTTDRCARAAPGARSTHDEQSCGSRRFGQALRIDRGPPGCLFVVRRGELFGLLGRTGRGKTTTVEILQGLRRADAGVDNGSRPRPGDGR